MRTTLCLIVAAFSARPAAAATSIAVNFTPHPSAKAAGHAEATVNWLDAAHTDDTVCTEAFAALELQRYLRRLTGRADDFRIVDDDGEPPEGHLLLVGGPGSNALTRKWLDHLDVGASKLMFLGPQSYRIRTARIAGRRVLAIAGARRVGTLYGVYGFLHRLGCRWFAPGKLHEHVPHIDRIPDINAAEAPSFLTRGFHAWEDRAPREFLLWMARNRLNYWCVEQSSHPLLHKLGIQMAAGSHDSQSRFLNPYAAYPYDHPRFRGDETKPKDPHPPSDDFRGDADRDGALSLFEAHPEWFPLVAGRRVPGLQRDRPTHGTNFCTSNPNAAGEFIRRFADAIAEGPYRDASIIRLWMADGGKWCRCAACGALGTPTDRYLRLVHRLERAIRKARADGRIARPITIRFLVYSDVLEPPSSALPAGFDPTTCIATFFPNRRSYLRPIFSPQSTANAPLHAALLGWAGGTARRYRGPLGIGEYYNVSKFHCLPLVLMHVMARDIPHYHKLGARHFHYMHVATAQWGNRALTNYQMARQLWDVNTDCEALWRDYFARRYGPAAATMRRFYGSLERAFANVTELRYTLARRLDRGKRTRPLFPTPQLRYRREPGVEDDEPTFLEMLEHVSASRKLLGQALAAELPPRIRARIAEDERLFTYGERTMLYYHACIQAYQRGWAGKLAQARRHYAEAVRLARLLEADTTSTSHAGEHASAPNAFVGTRAPRALERLARLLESLRGE